MCNFRSAAWACDRDDITMNRRKGDRDEPQLKAFMNNITVLAKDIGDAKKCAEEIR